MKWLINECLDTSFPVAQRYDTSGGSRISRCGAPTSDVGTFRQKCVQKRKNWILGGAGGDPLDPQMDTVLTRSAKILIKWVNHFGKIFV